jgi:predicted nucleic acid-binding protein
LTTFVDTSAMYALLDDADLNHEVADETFRFLFQGEPLLTHSHVIIESAAVVQRRLGSAAVRDLFDRLLPLIDVLWVDEALHATAVTSLLAAEKRQISLVDWTSFQVMRTHGIDRVFTFDGDFAQQGFEPVPLPQSSDAAISR